MRGSTTAHSGRRSHNHHNRVTLRVLVDILGIPRKRLLLFRRVKENRGESSFVVDRHDTETNPCSRCVGQRPVQPIVELFHHRVWCNRVERLAVRRVTSSMTSSRQQKRPVQHADFSLERILGRTGGKMGDGVEGLGWREPDSVVTCPKIHHADCLLGRGELVSIVIAN